MSTAVENLIANKNQLLKSIKKIDRVILDIATNGTASATLSAGGGSKSYTRLDIDKLRELRAEYLGRVAQINRRLAGLPSTGIRRILVTRC